MSFGGRKVNQRGLLSIVVGLVLSVFVLLPSASAQGDDAIEIETSGAGALRLGATLTQLGEALSTDFDVSEELEISPGQLGRVVTLDGGVWALLTVTDGVIDEIILVDSAFRTAAGIGPGSSVAEAEAVYGDATLTWFPDEQGQETAFFLSGPEGIEFYTSDSGGPRAGVYGEDQTRTVVVKPNATITTVRLACGASPCVYTEPPSGLDDAAPEDEPAEAPDETEADESVVEEPETDQPGAAEDSSPASDASSQSGDDELASTGLNSAALATLGFLLVGFGATAYGSSRYRHRALLL